MNDNYNLNNKQTERINNNNQTNNNNNNKKSSIISINRNNCININYSKLKGKNINIKLGNNKLFDNKKDNINFINDFKKSEFGNNKKISKFNSKKFNTISNIDHNDKTYNYTSRAIYSSKLHDLKSKADEFKKMFNFVIIDDKNYNTNFKAKIDENRYKEIYKHATVSELMCTNTILDKYKKTAITIINENNRKKKLDLNNKTTTKFNNNLNSKKHKSYLISNELKTINNINKDHSKKYLKKNNVDKRSFIIKLIESNENKKKNLNNNNNYKDYNNSKLNLSKDSIDKIINKAKYFNTINSKRNSLTKCKYQPFHTDVIDEFKLNNKINYVDNNIKRNSSCSIKKDNLYLLNNNRNSKQNYILSNNNNDVSYIYRRHSSDNYSKISIKSNVRLSKFKRNKQHNNNNNNENSNDVINYNINN